MQTLELYCPNCKRHTQHRHLVDAYGTQCSVCHGQTNQLVRAQTENLTYTAPDGTEGRVVHNTPDTVTFFVATGDYAGYYHYDKHTGKKSIDTRSSIRD